MTLVYSSYVIPFGATLIAGHGPGILLHHDWEAGEEILYAFVDIGLRHKRVDSGSGAVVRSTSVNHLGFTT